MIGLALLVIYLVWRGLDRLAAQTAYVVFEPRSAVQAPPGRRLDPTGKILLHASGRFSVAGKERAFCDLLAYWRTFASGEHVIMAIVHPSRFLLVAQRPSDLLGMWYIFLAPPAITRITVGRVAFGALEREGLRIDYQADKGTSRPARSPLRRPVAPTRLTVYLGFDHPDDRAIVWADLLADQANPGGQAA